MTKHLKNIPLKTFRKYLLHKGLKQIRTTGGHEVWSRKDLMRPVIIQTHITPVPEFIVKQLFKALKVDKQDFFDFLNL
jgi:predicted RNA binding protein YcfA (HicA-like mRNA interferase family)